MTDELEKYINSLTNYAYSICGDHNLSDDLVQTTLVKAIEKKETYKTDTSMRSWLRRILHNTYVDHLKHSNVRNAVSLEHIEIEAPTEEDTLRSTTQTEADYIQSMSGKEMEMFKLFAQGLTRKEVAERLGIPKGTVASAYQRAQERAQAYVARHKKD